MALPPLTYLSFDPVGTGVGVSQVLPYVECLAARGVAVSLHSFEQQRPAASIAERLLNVGVEWHPHRFGPGGPIGGAARVAEGAALVRGASLVHARSDLAAASCIVARRRHWIWDVRSFWTDQRIAIGMLRARSPEERVMRMVERRAAKSSTGIVTLTRAAVSTLAERFGEQATRKARVIPTCVDLTRFGCSDLPSTDTVKLLFSGSANAFYDTHTMLKFVERFRARRPVEFTVLSPTLARWHQWLQSPPASVGVASPDEMPEHVAAHHAGLSICRADAGVSLRAAVPTKLAEFLASGRPVIVNAGLGDMDELLNRYDCGVVLADQSVDAIDRAVLDLERLLSDRDMPARCRALAEAEFDLQRGVDELLQLYKDASNQ